MLEQDLRKAVDVVRAARRVLILSHLHPDIDTLGSALAMHHALSRMGKETVVFNDSGVPPTMKFLPGSEVVVTKVNARSRFDCTLALDSGNRDRFGGPLMDEKQRERLGVIIKIDHHKFGEVFADIDLTDTDSASTGELVYRFLKHYPVEPDEIIATNIYSAIVSDTGFFNYSNTSPGAMRDAADMLEHGVKPWMVSRAINENKEVADLQILADVLQTLQISDCGRFATLYVTQEMKKLRNAHTYMLEGFVNYARSIKGVEVSALLREEGEGLWKASLRSAGNVDVAEICAKLGGGGHANAAGCHMNGTLPSVRKKLEGLVMKRLARLDTGK